MNSYKQCFIIIDVVMLWIIYHVVLARYDVENGINHLFEYLTECRFFAKK